MTIVPVDDKFPPLSCPNTFADGVLNLAPGPGVVKFYLYRVEPSIDTADEFRNQPVGQVVMPTEGFVQTTIFFLKSVEGMISNGQFSKERFEELKRLVDVTT